MAVRYIKSKKNKKTIDVVIPAAGIGTRMKVHGPKSLININGKTLIERQLELLEKHFRIGRTILVCGYDAIRVMNNTPDYILKIENENYENTNVVRSLGMGLRLITNDVLILYGDLIFNAEALTAIDINETSVVVSEDIMKFSEVGCVVTEGKVEHLMYDLKPKWAQIGFFTGFELNLLKQMCWNPNRYKHFGFEILNSIIDKRGNIKACTNKNMKIMDLDSQKDIKIAQEVFND